MFGSDSGRSDARPKRRSRSWSSSRRTVLRRRCGASGTSASSDTRARTSTLARRAGYRSPSRRSPWSVPASRTSSAHRDGMAEIVFDEQTIKYVALFQDLTRTTVVDCVDAGDKLIFVVKEGDIGKAIGKKGENIAKLKRLMSKEIHVVEYSDQPYRFVANVFRNFDVKSVQIEQRGEVVHATVTVEATKKGRAIGKEGRNLKVSRDLIARHHSIQSVSVA